MKKPVDYENLRRVIEAGVSQACKDAGLERFAVQVRLDSLAVGNERGLMAIPLVAVEATELSKEQLAELTKYLETCEGN